MKWLRDRYTRMRITKTTAKMKLILSSKPPITDEQAKEVLRLGRELKRLRDSLPGGM